MEIAVEAVASLRFDDGAPVRAASAIVPFGTGWLVAQDDATHAAWLRDGGITRVRVLPPVAGLETFDDAAGTKHLKPDLEGGFAVPDRPGQPRQRGSVVLLGSGSSPTRMRAALVRAGADGPLAAVTDLSPLYVSAGRALGVTLDVLNLEGACVVDGALRWFQRGVPSAGVPTASVDVDLADLLAALAGGRPPGEVRLTGARRYELGTVDGVGLAITDAVRLRDGSTLVSAAAEDTDDPRDDGPVVASALAVIDDGVVIRSAPLPRLDGTVPKVEGLAVVDDGTSAGRPAGQVRLLATVDSDDPIAASLAVTLRAWW